MNPLPQTILQRSHGTAQLGFRRRGRGTQLDTLYQAGSAKAFVHPGVPGPDVVMLNTSGGMTGGDRLDLALSLAPGCHVRAATQTAERIYRAGTGEARVHVRLDLGEGAHLDWLPQETILFDGAALSRQTEVTLGPGASCLVLESVVLGRTAMGEALRDLRLSDRRTIRRGDRPILVEPLILDTAALAAGPGVLAGARAFASLALVQEGAESRLDRVRAALVQEGVSAGASALEGRLMLRLMAADGWQMRRLILRLLPLLTDRAPPPVWMM